MPKLIENLRERLLDEAREVLLAKGLDALSVRDVAAACNVAAGTVYNYFSSKEELVAHAILSDWLNQMSQLRKKIASCSSINDGLLAIRLALKDFSSRYRLAFAQSDVSLAGSAYTTRHAMLRDQLVELLDALTQRFNYQPTNVSLYVMAETLLASLTQEWPDAEILSVLHKLIEKGGLHEQL